MRTITLVMFAALACAGPAAEQPAREPVASSADAETRDALEKARDVVWRAWFAGDTATLARVIPGALAASEGNGWSDLDKTIAGSREFAAGGGKLLELTFDSTTFALHGSVAIVTARYATTTVEPGSGKQVNTSGYAVEVFVLENGQWVNPFWHLK
jgi:hypothetical protein